MLGLASSVSSFSTPLLVAECKDTSEKIDLYTPYGLYIKPVARLNITIQLPASRLPGQTVSHNELIDKLKVQIQPEEFTSIRVLKSTLEFVRLEAEIENKSSFKVLLTKLDNSLVQMSNYVDCLRVRAAEAKLVYPNRYEWESFYKEGESDQIPIELKKPGERPDTIYITDLPCKWFADRKIIMYTSDFSTIKPSEMIVREVFSIFGEIRLVDLILHNNGSKKPAAELFGFNNESMPTFEAYIQYKEYISFVKAMDTFRGMKLLHIDDKDHSAFTANIKVDFDRTRHLSDKEIQRRKIEGLKNIEIEKIKSAQQEREKDKEAKQREIASFRAMLEESRGSNDEGPVSRTEEKTKEQRRREREEARRRKRLAQKQLEEERKIEQKIALEERKMLVAQRKLESMRLLEELFNRVKVIVAQEELEKREKELKKEQMKREREEMEQDRMKKIKFEQEEQELKDKVAKNLAEAEKNSSDEEEEFELRKNLSPMDKSNQEDQDGQTESNFGEAGSSIALPPRALLLSSTTHLPASNTKQSPKFQLYDDDEEANQDTSSNLMAT